MQETAWQGYYIAAPETAFHQCNQNHQIFCGLHQFPIAVVALVPYCMVVRPSYCCFVLLGIQWLKAIQIYYSVLEVKCLEWVSTKIRWSAGCIPSGGSLEESLSLSVTASRGCLNSVVHGLLLSSEPAKAGRIVVISHRPDSPSSLF